MAERQNMEISLNKTKSLTISRNYTKCEVQLRGTPIEQVPQFNYLGAEISAKRNLNPYPTAFPYGNGTVLHFYQQQESSTTKTVHKVINKGLKTYV